MILLALLVLGAEPQGIRLRDEGGAAKAVREINFTGAGVTCTTSSTFGTCDIPGGGGASAPTNAQYWTGAADGTLSAEHNLGALGTGLVVNTAGTPSAYAGSTCGAGTFATATNASGVLTCSTPTNYLKFITFTVTAAQVAAAAGAVGTYQFEHLNQGIPAKARVTRVVIDVTQGFDDGAGPMTTSNLLCGNVSGGGQFMSSFSIFTTSVRGDSNTEAVANIGSIYDWSAGTDFWCQWSCSGALLNALTTGSATFYIEYVLYP